MGATNFVTDRQIDRQLWCEQSVLPFHGGRGLNLKVKLFKLSNKLTTWEQDDKDTKNYKLKVLNNGLS